jgi:hypothetical protein
MGQSVYAGYHRERCDSTAAAARGGYARTPVAANRLTAARRFRRLIDSRNRAALLGEPGERADVAPAVVAAARVVVTLRGSHGNPGPAGRVSRVAAEPHRSNAVLEEVPGHAPDEAAPEPEALVVSEQVKPAQLALVIGMVASIRLRETDQLSIHTLDDEAVPERIVFRELHAPLPLSDFDARAALPERRVRGIPGGHVKPCQVWDVGRRGFAYAQVAEGLAAS